MHCVYEAVYSNRTIGHAMHINSNAIVLLSFILVQRCGSTHQTSSRHYSFHHIHFMSQWLADLFGCMSEFGTKFSS